MPSYVANAHDNLVANFPGRPTELLEEGWAAAYGRSPDPETAFAKAVRAVEVSMRPIVSPSDKQATLTKMTADMRAKPEKWATGLVNLPERVAAIEKIAGMLDLFKAQQRHASGTNSQEEAQAALQLAVVLVFWFSAGMIVRKNSEVDLD